MAACRVGRWVAMALLAWLPQVVGQGAGEAAAARVAVRSACEVGYPPFSIVREDGSATGFAVELLRAALAAVGRDASFRTGPWTEVKGWLEQGEVEALPLVGRTPEREGVFDFTFPYMTLHGAIVVREGTADIQTLDDLTGRRVGVMRGDNAEEFLRRSGLGLEIATTTTFEEALESLADGQCDAVVMQRLVALRLVQQTGIGRLRILPRPVAGFVQDFCFAVREGDRDTLALLNEGLALVMADGTYRRLHAEWFAALELGRRSVIVVGGDANLPPYEFLDENSRPAGHNVDLTKAIAREAGFEVQIRLGPWEEIRAAFERGQIDALQGMFYSKRRGIGQEFSQPHAMLRYVGVTRRGSGAPPAAVGELAGKRVAVQAGDIMHDWLVEQGLTAGLMPVSDQEQALEEVAAGRADCALVARLPALHWIRLHCWRGLEVGTRPLLMPEYCYAVRQGDDALLALLEGGLKAVEVTGELRVIRRTWLGVDDAHGVKLTTVLGYVGLGAAPLVLALLAALAWSRSLRRQVARRTAELGRELEEHRQADGRQELTTAVLGILNEPLGLHDAVDRALAAIQQGTGADAAGMRLKDGDDFPYFSQNGFGEDFLSTEDSLAQRLAGGDVCRNEDGSVCLECTCGLVLAGRTDPGSPLFTPGGSFWTNDSPSLLGVPAEDDPRLHPRNRCIHDGYASVALVPIRADGEIMGLLQLNYRSRGSLAIALIRCLEGIGTSIGIALMRKRAEERRRQSEASLQQILESVSFGVAVIGRDKRVRRANQAAVEMAGYQTEAEVLGRICHDTLCPAEAGACPVLDLGATVDRSERLLRHRDGGTIPILKSVVPIFLNGEDVLLESYVDISQLKRAEEELRMGYNRESTINQILGLALLDLPIEEMLDRALGLVLAMREFAFDEKGAIFLVEAVPDVLVLKAQRNFSPSLLADCAHVPFGKCLCGRAAASGQMQSATDVDARHEVHYEGMQAHGHHCVPMRIGERTVGVLNLYLQAGQARSARLEQFTLGVANALAGVISRIQAEDEKARLQVQLTQSQKMESIGRLAGGVAHDFNNKLMTILGNAELCQLDLEKDHPAREYVDDIVACAGQAGNLTRQLLAFARKQTIEPEVLDLNDAIDGTLRMLRRLIGENIDLTWQPGPGLWPVLVDPSQVDQILANLTVNARDAIAGTGRIGIGTANQPVDASYAGAHVDAMPGDYVTLTVADDGCGMGADVQAHLFEPFFTTKGIGKGTGLGLATVYGIVRQNGGFITVYSEPGKGSTFRVHLPRSLEEVRLNGTGDAEAAMPVAHGAETVLLVEDEERLLRSATDLLGRLGYTVLAAASAAQAVELAHRHGTGIDLLLTDVVMPEMNGRELRDRLVALLPSLRCIFMSGYTADIIAPAGVLERGVHFLQKPFTLRQLAIKVREALDASQAAN